MSTFFQFNIFDWRFGICYRPEYIYDAGPGRFEQLIISFGPFRILLEDEIQ